MSAHHPPAPQKNSHVLTSPVIGTLVHARDRIDERTRLGGVRFFLELGFPLAAVEALMRALVPSLLAYVNDPDRVVDILRRCAYGHLTLFHPQPNADATLRAVDGTGQRCGFLLPHPKLPVVFACSYAKRITVLKVGTPGTQATSEVGESFLPIEHYYNALSIPGEDALELTPQTTLQTPREEESTPRHFFLFQLNYFFWRTNDPPEPNYSTQTLVDDQDTPNMPPDPQPYDARQQGIVQRMFHLPHWQRETVGFAGDATATPPYTLTINGTPYKFPPALKKILELNVPLLASAEQVTQDNFNVLTIDNAMFPQLVIPGLREGTQNHSVPNDQLPRTSADRNRREHERTLDIALEPKRYAEDRD